jgi:hypothetical protein
MNNAIKEALKELGRLVLMAAVSWAVAELTKLPQDQTVVYGVAILRLVDKALHEYGKEHSTKKVQSWALGGLTRF